MTATHARVNTCEEVVGVSSTCISGEVLLSEQCDDDDVTLDDNAAPTACVRARPWRA